jgi:hypothetical protein
MRECHPTDGELARLSDKRTGGGVSEHVRSCARCRRVLADYDWLQGELAETLAGVADTVPVRRSAWPELQDKILDSKRRQSVRMHVSAMTSAAMAICLLLYVPAFIRPSAAGQALQPKPSVRPTPIVVTEPTGDGSRSPSSGTSATWIAFRQAPRSSAAPALAPLPTPPDHYP